ncbi:MAG: hypothetical protein COZ49_04505 [Candidatus Yonathbacteria bacterium CG_4_10_14_3_um_filter_47_65]|uniref:Uncharacterized protein n=2 Tax=Parcubacteria group TaxID=1794811 RepID=A0A2M8DAE8_9BACT|nr:MAG: hypothetical protein AUJ44_03730 [Candidatus Nomurabacteria bacterium CG1_02_47_685]PIP03361.1 MAG: hypothetical protein COX54_03895 [Candidatus Yonathbacteria bacterium CG23_combo_of_CG06-09_8_20_14_all_46_18]PIQ31124.1 MAG: hypothetical protein COW61_04385 [Candidatus Yonathbacteria bacterium CG17_big_fil_post_rev_8_21_14_2_50_46_19]PIX55987.1 MAG: hypothetical protein COZ49_04505 [Candidatus Yonathbacteria bacterium CG_4_10_14_3_um_filter_47_65]PIY57723.1 MAG: hypothetical protein CO
MSILVILFLVSLAGTVGMIGYRFVVPFSETAAAERIDDERSAEQATLWFPRRTFSTVFYPRIRRLFSYVMNMLVPAAKNTVMFAKNSIRKKYASLVAKMNDNTEHSKRGAASFFLKDIAHHKEELKKRKK